MKMSKKQEKKSNNTGQHAAGKKLGIKFVRKSLGNA
jgi:hypothetical protein